MFSVTDVAAKRKNVRLERHVLKFERWLKPIFLHAFPILSTSSLSNRIKTCLKSGAIQFEISKAVTIIESSETGSKKSQLPNLLDMEQLTLFVYIHELPCHYHCYAYLLERKLKLLIFPAFSDHLGTLTFVYVFSFAQMLNLTIWARNHSQLHKMNEWF